MKKTLLLFLLCTSLSSAFASSVTTHVIRGRERPQLDFEEKNWILSVSNPQMVVADGFYRRTRFGLQFRAEYLVAERLAFGLASDLRSNWDFSNRLVLGPSLTYHFWNAKLFSSYVGLTYFPWDYTASTFFGRVNSRIGFNINPVHWFGIGSHLAWDATDRTNQITFSLINLFFYL